MPAGRRGGDGSFPSSAQKPVDPPQSAPRWTFSTEAIVLGRTGGANQPLVGLLPGGTQFAATQNAAASAAEAFNSNQFWQGFSAGPKISVTYHDESGYGAEFSYFNIFTQSATKTVGPTNPANPPDSDWLVMYAPGSFWQTQDFPYQGMAWKDATNLYSAEANGRLDFSPRRDRAGRIPVAPTQRHACRLADSGGSHRARTGKALSFARRVSPALFLTFLPSAPGWSRGHLPCPSGRRRRKTIFTAAKSA